jgi:DnaJ-class molecular chaperone
MLVFFVFISSLFFAGLAAYIETTRRPQAKRDQHTRRLQLRGAGLEERLELCMNCHGDRVVAIGQVVKDIKYEECEMCKGRGFVEVLRKADGCPCDLCVGDK